MALHSLGPLLFSTNPEDQINFLIDKSKGLLQTQQNHPSCSNSISMAWKRQLNYGDKFTWCMKSESFSQNLKYVPLQTWLQLMHHWSMDMPITQAAKQAKQCIDIYQFMSNCFRRGRYCCANCCL